MFKQILQIGAHYLATTFRSRSVLLFTLLMPLIFTFVLGNVIGGESGDEPVRWHIAVVDQDNSPMSQLLSNRLQSSPSLAIQYLDVAEAEAGVREEELAAAVVVPAGFGQAIQSGQPAAVSLITSGTQVRTAQSIEQALRASLSESSSIVQAARISQQVTSRLALAGEAGEAGSGQDTMEQAQWAWDQSRPIRVTAQPVHDVQAIDPVADGFDQSSPGMLVTFGLVLMLNGAAVLVIERERGTLRRLLVMPISKFSILAGKLAGIFVAGLVQATVLIVAGALLFGVEWGRSPWALVTVVVAFSLSITSLGMMIAGIVRTYDQANALSNILMYSIAAFGGAWWPIEITPQWMQEASKAVPTYWAMQGFQDIIARRQGLTAVLPETAALLGFAVVFLAIGVRRFRYQ